MTPTSTYRLRKLLGASALVLALIAGPVNAETIFTPTSDGFVGSVDAGGEGPSAPVYKGGTAVIEGEGLVPGQKLTLLRGPTVLNPDGPLVVDGDGNFSFKLAVDADAATGLQPIVVIGENPAAATVVDLKISPQVPISGTDRFSVTSEPVTRGLYQVARNNADGALFVTAAVGRPPVKESSLLKIDAESLSIVSRTTPAPAPQQPDGEDGGLYAVYGVAVDNVNNHVWVTNTRQDTAAVYSLADLTLVKQFEPGAVPHSRDVAVDTVRGRVYASAVGTGHIDVFDAATLEKLAPIEIASEAWGEDFTSTSLSIDPEAGKLFTVSMTTPEAAVIDLASGAVEIVKLPGAVGAIGVAHDPKEGLLFVASQSSDNLLIVKLETGEVLHDVEVGAGPLNVAFEPTARLAFVSNRGSGTITAVDTSGKIVANLEGGTFPNHLIADGHGTVYAVNKSRGENDPAGDRIWRVTPVAN